MTIYVVNENPRDSIYERQLPNGTYRYEGYFHSIKYCIDSQTRKTEQQINKFLNSRSVEYLLNKEGYIINIK